MMEYKDRRRPKYIAFNVPFLSDLVAASLQIHINNALALVGTYLDVHPQ